MKNARSYLLPNTVRVRKPSLSDSRHGTPTRFKTGGDRTRKRLGRGHSLGGKGRGSRPGKAPHRKQGQPPDRKNYRGDVRQRTSISLIQRGVAAEGPSLNTHFLFQLIDQKEQKKRRNSEEGRKTRERQDAEIGWGKKRWG